MAKNLLLTFVISCNAFTALATADDAYPPCKQEQGDQPKSKKQKLDRETVLQCVCSQVTEEQPTSEEPITTVHINLQNAVLCKETEVIGTKDLPEDSDYTYDGGFFAEEHHKKFEASSDSDEGEIDIMN